MANVDHLDRVSEKIAIYVVDFCGQQEDFLMSQLLTYVRSKVSNLAPDSPGRILRDLRQKGVLDYRVVDRKNSHYRVMRTCRSCFGVGFVRLRGAFQCSDCGEWYAWNA